MGEWESGGIRDAVEIPSSCSSTLPLFHSSSYPLFCRVLSACGQRQFFSTSPTDRDAPWGSGALARVLENPGFSQRR